MSGWPTDNELGQLLVGSKVCKTAPDWIGGVVLSAVSQLEDLTGWTPFLSTGNAVTKRVNPVDDGKLWLPCGFLSISSVYVGVNSSSDGSALTRDTDYADLPVGAWENGLPVDRLESLSLRGTTPRSISVTGIVGRMLESDPRFDSDVCFWLLRGAAAGIYLEASGQPGTVTRLKQGPVDIEYSDKETAGAMRSWEKGFLAMVSRYKRTVV